MRMKLADPYKGFSNVFERIVSVEKYDRWEALIRSVWKKNSFSPRSLVDLACGTGLNGVRFSKELEVFGVDSSASMLERAKEKGSSVEFLKGNFLNFILPKNVDAALCLDFSTNYILRTDEFVEFLNRVESCLNEGGLFILDFKPTQAFKKKERHLEEKEFVFDWKCNVEHAPFVIIDIEVKMKEGETFKERHIERGYSWDEMKKIIEGSNFYLKEVYDNCTLKEPAESSELIQVVLQKV